MKKYLIIALVLVVVAVGSTIWLRAAPPAPTVGIASVTPAYVVINTPTTVLVMISIVDPTLLSNGVNLLKTDVAGKTLSIIGVMKDDGLNGDVTANDKVFTYRLTLNEPAVGTVFYRASAAFKGVMLRTLSNVISVATLIPRVSSDVGTAGGVITAQGSSLSLTVPSGALSGTVSFTIELLQLTDLPAAIPPTMRIYGIVNVDPSPHLLAGDPGPTSAYLTVIVLPLLTPLSPGTALSVLEPTPSGVNWHDSGVIATVRPDGVSATFSTKRIGLFVLTNLK